MLIPAEYDLESVANQAGNAVLSIAAVWAAFGPYLMAQIKARDKVTPLEDPRTVTGERLTPAGS